MEFFMMGAIAMASAIVALFFLRFWRDTGDRLFAIFALAFLLLGITRLGLAASQAEGAARNQRTTVAPVDSAPGRIADAAAAPQLNEGETHWYWLRFAAFLLILGAIVDKNRR
jgi:hypothetical protein